MTLNDFVETRQASRRGPGPDYLDDVSCNENLPAPEDAGRPSSENRNDQFSAQMEHLPPAQDAGSAGRPSSENRNDLFSAQTMAPMVDPEATQLQLNGDVEMPTDESLSQRAKISCGVDCSKRSNQVICSVLLALATALVIGVLFTTDVIGPPSSAIGQPTSNPPTVSGSPRPRPFPVTFPPTPFPATFPPTPPPVPNTIPPTLKPSPRPVTAAPVTSAPIAPSISSYPSVRVAQWVQVGNTIDGESNNDESGAAVALSSDGTVLAISAFHNDAGGLSSGHVRVYTNSSSGAWLQRGIDLDGSKAYDQFGFSVALSANGTILAVGARWADGVNGTSSGQAYVYEWIGNGWQQKGSTIDGESASDQFGNSIALSDDGTVLAVGAWGNGAGGDLAGHVRIFSWNGTDWNQRGNDLDGSSGDLFGDSVSLSSTGDVVACGGYQPDPDNSFSLVPGYVRIYRWDGFANWVQQGPTLFGNYNGDGLGDSVSLSGDGKVVAVGARRGNYAVMYRNIGTDWFQIGEQIPGLALGRFGFSVSLSFDGSTVVIGDYEHDSNGDGSGHAAVYRLSTNNNNTDRGGEEWIQVGQDLFGEAAHDYFGFSTSISDDGNRIAIGQIGSDGTGNRVGGVKVFDLIK